MIRKELLYEGKAKKVYLTDEADSVIVEYKDDATAFDGLKRGKISGKGIINNKMSNYMMRLLQDRGIRTHLLEQIDARSTVVRKVTMLPLEVIVRNNAAGSLSERLGLPEGTPMTKPVVEFNYKSDELHDPLVNEYHIGAMGWTSKQRLDEIAQTALQINEILKEYLQSVGIVLIDFKLQFGIDCNGELVLADEISPDTCRFWDSQTYEKLDKDRFRRDMGGVIDAYQEAFDRILKQHHEI